MNLNYTLEQPLLDVLSLSEEEEIWYSVPVDLSFDQTHKLAQETYTAATWLVVTPLRLVILQDGQITKSFPLKDCRKIKCEHQVNSGILIVTDTNEQQICAARFSMRHIIRVSYVARGAQSMSDAMKKGLSATDAERVTSQEYERYCAKCGRALPGTSHCPYCEGKGILIKKFMDLCGEYVGRLLFISMLMICTAAINLTSPMIQQHFTLLNH